MAKSVGMRLWKGMKEVSKIQGTGNMFALQKVL
jgi:hypothetical protein